MSFMKLETYVVTKSSYHVLMGTLTLLTLSLQGVPHWPIKLSGVRQSKIYKRSYMAVKGLRVCGKLVSCKKGIFHPIELFHRKSMGNKSSIIKSSISHRSYYIIMRNLLDIFTLWQLVWVFYGIVQCPYTI